MLLQLHGGKATVQNVFLQISLRRQLLLLASFKPPNERCAAGLEMWTLYQQELLEDQSENRISLKPF